MNYKVLVTLDLPNADDNQRKTFYEHLKLKQWSKVDPLTTTWKLNFTENSTVVGIATTIKNHLNSAAQESKIKKVEYGYQLGYDEVTIDKIRL